MKNLIKPLLISASLAASLVTANVWANDSVHFLPGYQGEQYFECNTTADSLYSLQTHNVKLQGACPSGKVNDVSSETLNTSYFSVNDAGLNPSVDVIGPDVKCTIVKDHTKTNDFGAGQGFCALSPVGKTK